MNKCFRCSKKATFECWQYYDIKTARHKTAEWCSESCFDSAHLPGRRITFNRPGKHHRHSMGKSCAGER